MIVYSGTKAQFDTDVVEGNIAKKVEYFFEQNLGIHHGNESEFNSWEESLTRMNGIMRATQLDDNVKVAIEYQVPMTSKRVDFLITGRNSENKDNVIVIELKQWEKAERTSLENVVKTYTGGSNKVVAHPSYQAYSYAKTIENFNETVQLGNIGIYPCAYLHNYSEKYKGEIANNNYAEIIQLSPLFLKEDSPKLIEFIKKYICKSDDGSILYKIENGKIKPSKALQDSLASMINGNEEFIMIDEQLVAYSTVKKLVQNKINTNKKYTVIIEGGPGTGKSVIAINLLVDLIKSGYNACYTSKNQAPRDVYFEKLRQNNFKMDYIKTLFKGASSFYGCPSNTFDCILSDEAHRLAKKSFALGKGENQVKEIINASRISIFFIDPNQMVNKSDIGTIDEIMKWAKEFNSEIIYNDEIKLTSQFRCNGSDGYIAFLDDLLGIRQTANANCFDLEYDIRVFDNPNAMRECLREKNLINNKARMLAGYCYDWTSNKAGGKDEYDICLEDGFRAQWNFKNSIWAIDENSFDQVGCIHTCQGLEFDYVGVIIGNDLRYSNGYVITDASARSTEDKTLSKTTPFSKADAIIRNTYKTLMTRGQKGCYIYCENKELSNYIKIRLDMLKKERENWIKIHQ